MLRQRTRHPFSDLRQSWEARGVRWHVPEPQMRAGQVRPNLRTTINTDRTRKGRKNTRFSASSTNRRRSTEEGASPSSVRVRSRTSGSDTLRSRGGGLEAAASIISGFQGGGEDRHAHKMNLIGLTSSRKQSRTNAYTARILLLDGNAFSSCVRSRKRTRIVVCKNLSF